ncbi:MAG: type I DNA topoisomerase [Pegethrix bostrychoides GSE-TBD4-15B]|uniref:DNA topoisomerase 1 n=1 Tax=Pegethrix bostrychoides GSE-TBD4-15B TaxID=2839662 RepID=A0A951PAP5_9CYAN|nr:type I DNA topoisomerase [Pegethrix bostrychoides GSE-TBD4-15B]
MATKLLIVESPGKVKKLSQILGSDWLVRASMGHVRELANDGVDSLGFDLSEDAVSCRYTARGSRGQETIQNLRAAVRQVKTVVLATDYDREGETIAWHIQQALNLKNPQRVVYSEITPAAVQAAVARPRSIDLNLVNSGLCRAVLDKLVGYRGSPLLWALQNGAKSMGRVQSAALHIICSRERQIQAFVPQDYWSVFVEYAEGFRAYYRGAAQAAEPSAELSAEPPAIPAEATDDAASPTEAPRLESARVTTEAEANRLVQLAPQSAHQVITIEGRTTTRQPPPAFVTSTLQQAAGSRLRFSPEKTMQVAQSLYEAGLITYMRTDSVSLSPEFCTQARQWLEANDPANLPQKTAKHRQVKGSQEAHEAIRPTDLYRPSQELRVQLSADDFALYLLIWKRSMATQCQSARLRQTRIVTQSGSITWQARGQVIEFHGYSKYWNNISADTDLPLLQPNQTLTLSRAAHEPKQTQPPPRYSEPKLVQAMERQGIGRPSTYAPTIQTLKQRLYVDLNKGSLQPTELGLEVDAFLQDALPDLLEAEFTAQMEQALDQIAAGEQDWEHYLTDWNRSYFAPALLKARQVIPQHLTSNPAPRHHQSHHQNQTLERSRSRCPQCNAYLAKVPSRKLKKKYFLKCTDCTDLVLFWSDKSRQWEAPRPKNADLPKPEPTEHPCPICKQPLESYAYEKDGQVKRLLRCSDPKARADKKHQDAVYFQTAQGWWSPKFGALE